ncbi:MAG: hypothetical protein NTY09_07650 [bacterium]|nr:hypothetical protein [bacterium]
MSDEETKFTPEDLEPGDKSEKQTGFDWCLAAGCAGCVDPVGCVNAIGQAFVGCLHGCLAQIGCGTFLLIGFGFGIYRLVVLFTG